MTVAKTLSITAIVLGALLYVVAVSGMLWPATPPTDVGILATAGPLVLFGAFGLLLARNAPVAA